MAKTYNFTTNEATREKIQLRAALCGTTGSGKTLTALRLGDRMVEKLGTGPLFVIDSEHRSALRYAWRNGSGVRFKHVEMPPEDNSPDAYEAAVAHCEAQGAGVILIDSLSHAWAGINGVLEQVDRVTDNSRSKNAFSTGWKELTPRHQRFVERIMQTRAHLVVTLRAKADWAVQQNDRGKAEPVKVGLAPVQREGVDYEFDVFATMTAPDNTLIIEKGRALDVEGLRPGARHTKPGAEFFDAVIAWVEDGEAPADPLAVQLENAIAASTDKPSYEAARASLIDWMKARSIPRDRGTRALTDLDARVRALLQPRATA